MRSHELFLFFCAVLISSVRAQNFTLTGEEQQQLDVAAGAQIVLRLWTSPGVRSGSWRFNCRDVAVWIGNITDVNNAYSDRAQLFTDGSLSLKSLTVNDSGDYLITMNPVSSNVSVTSLIDLKVIEPVSKPNISSNISDPIEQKDTVALTCHVTGDVRFIYWIKTNQSIQNEERMMLSLDNVTLTIASVNRSDAGDYMCQAWGHTNNEESDPFSLDVSYGPDTPQLTIEDEKEVYAPESDITLRCSADSVPPATFEWLLNGKPLGKTGKKLTLVSITMSDCGNYTCKAHNNHTDSYAEATKEISLVEGITKPKITANASYLVEHNDTVTLTCEVSGHWQTLRWEKNQQVLSGSGNMKVSEGNKTLTISPVDRSDAGNYTCWAETPTITKESDLFKLTIYYGPDEPQVIMAPENQAISPGSNVTLTCKVESFPHSKFRWYQNGVQLPVNDEHLTISNITQSNSSNYTCETYNEKTKLTQQKTRQISLSVRDDLEDYKNKSWIAAAVVGVLVLIAVCACVIFKQRGS
ncbi:carcinoembryonic antigen-related cell adhesion molecule 6-like isoform X3 [Carcharodon carcharias]|uniref:carcinoembryonic antigen-related cell adhesion molecule 6-like isoform X3 n=1 Tax=Carcharodon carcharias TaxID=13397 RepID=UPI001B7EA5C7|nr:carcinoembryonic antigen-related cell adhesion molecule 6-like isoform X3 [Carcharodon carcharias]